VVPTSFPFLLYFYYLPCLVFFFVRYFFLFWAFSWLVVSGISRLFRVTKYILGAFYGILNFVIVLHLIAMKLPFSLIISSQVNGWLTFQGAAGTFWKAYIAPAERVNLFHHITSHGKNYWYSWFAFSTLQLSELTQTSLGG
jgi:hypothetical protein